MSPNSLELDLAGARIQRLDQAVRMGNLSPAETTELLQLLEHREYLISRRMFFEMYPKSGPLSRHAYDKAMQFFAAGGAYSERAFMAANRVGKTLSGAYETVCHLTGIYPEWWTGKRFARPTSGWACGNTAQKCKEIVQAKLLGTPGVPSLLGTGMVPGDLIVGVPSKKRGVADAIETVFVRHVSGGLSMLTFKSYDQGRESFEGTEQDFIWLDEEPPEDIYAECLMRTMTTSGVVFLTFTPLKGMSKVCLEFLPGGRIPQPGEPMTRFIIQATWDDAPHLTPEKRAEYWGKLPPHQRRARSQGLPVIEEGEIYPIDEAQIMAKDIVIPKHWPRCYALDVGWNWTAGLWGALDRESGIAYWYSVHKEAAAVPAVHATAVKGRGAWIPGVIDPAANGRSQKDGEKLFDAYVAEGLNIIPAENAVEAGIYAVWQAKLGGKLKVFKSLSAYWTEHRMYRRDKNGKVVKSHDHVMDCERYLYAAIFDRARTQTPPPNPHQIIGSYAGAPSAMCS